MTQPTTLLLTAPQKTLIAGILQQRPDWQIVPLGELPPAEALPGPAWGFIDWLLPEISGLELCRRLRGSPTTKAAHLTMVLDAIDGDARQRALQQRLERRQQRREVREVPLEEGPHAAAPGREVVVRSLQTANEAPITTDAPPRTQHLPRCGTLSLATSGSVPF